MTEDHSYPIPANDPSRTRLMDAMDIKRRRDDPFFAHAIASARRIFDAPVAFLSLIADEEQTFLAIDGADETGTPRSWSMCSYTVAARAPIISADTHDDPRFREHPIVINPPHIRFSASAPVILSNGFCLGTICAVDMVPHGPPEQAQIDQLTDLAAMVARFYEVPSEPDAQKVEEIQAIVNEAQDHFLSLIGHELRTPLNGIVGLSHCLDAPTEDQREIIAAMQDTASHLNDLITSILSFTELSSGDIQLSERHDDLAAILQRANNRLDKVLQLREKSVDVSADAKIPLLCDPDLLDLAVTCLIDNVCKHGGRRARLSCGMSTDGSAEIRVVDDGPGIAEDRLDAIWSAFSVGEDLNARRSDGLGLGLPMTRRIIELHGGRFGLEPTETGITATITLPPWRVGQSEGTAAPAA